MTEPSRLPPDDERTAYHEAAHAIIGLRRGFRLVWMQIATAGAAFGGCQWDESSWPSVDLWPARAEDRPRFRAMVEMFVAGDEAARVLRGTGGAFARSQDYGRAGYWSTFLVTGDQAAKDAVIQPLAATVRQELIESWQLLTALAGRLTEARFVTGAEAVAILSASSAKGAVKDVR